MRLREVMGKIKKKNEISEIPTGKNLLSGRFFNDEKKKIPISTPCRKSNEIKISRRSVAFCRGVINIAPRTPLGYFAPKLVDITKKIETKIKNRFIVFVLNLFE